MDQEDSEDPDGQSFEPRPSKITKMDHVNDQDGFDDHKNPDQGQREVVELNTQVDQSLGHLDDHKDPSNNDDNDDSFQSKPTNQLKIEEFDDKNPFQVSVILDVVFKLLSFEEVKNFRLISSTWNDVGLKEISKRPQKPIKFNRIEDLGEEDILGHLIQLQKSHQVLFGFDHQLFYNFFFNIPLLSSPQIDQFLYHFSTTKFVGFYGYPTMKDVELPNGTYREVQVEESDPQIPQFLSKFLIKISPTVQELQYDDLYLYDFDEKQSLESYKELATTKFHNLRKININMSRYYDELKKMFYYPVLGQNSPKLRDFTIGSDSTISFSFGSPEEMKEMLDSTGLIPKLKNLELNNTNPDLLNGFAEFSQNSGMLKLTKLKFETNNPEGQSNEIFVRLISTQSESLKILKISTPYSYTMSKSPFPPLKHLSFLQIDNFENFETFYEPINFSIQFPKVETFQTNQIKRFVHKNLGKGGDYIKYCTFYNKKLTHLENSRADRDDHRIDFVKFGQIFPNLEFLELNADALPSNYASSELENLPFWSQLRKVIIHCHFNNDLANFNLPILKAIKKCEIVVHCEEINMMNEDFYKDYLGFIISSDNDDNSGYYNREKFYKMYLTTISNSLKSIHTVSYTIIGYKISEDFKRDFREIFPETNFICSPFKSPDDY